MKCWSEAVRRTKPPSDPHHREQCNTFWKHFITSTFREESPYWKSDSFSPGQETIRPLWDPKVQNSPPLVLIPKEINSVQTLSSTSILILSSYVCLDLRAWFLLSGFSIKIPNAFFIIIIRSSLVRNFLSNSDYFGGPNRFPQHTAKSLRRSAGGHGRPPTKIPSYAKYFNSCTEKCNFMQIHRLT